MKLQFKYYVLFALVGVFSFGEINAQNKVLIIGIDGTRPDALLAAKTPNLDKLWQNGAYTFKAKTDDLSWSGVCWTSMLTGVWKEKHNVYGNGYENPNTEEYPHFFNLARQQQPNLRTYSIINWSPIHNILKETDATVMTHKLTDGLVTKSVTSALKNEDVDAMFVHLDNVDHAGHSTGFTPSNPKYIRAIEKTDKKIGKIVKALKKRKNYANENWLILVSTDHGGSGTNHGEATPEHTTTFYIASGKDVEKGEIQKQVYITDVAVTALKHLNIVLKDEWKLDGHVSGLK